MSYVSYLSLAMLFLGGVIIGAAFFFLFFSRWILYYFNVERKPDEVLEEQDYRWWQNRLRHER